MYRYTGEFLLFSYPYMELWRSSLMFRSFVYQYTRTQPSFAYQSGENFDDKKRKKWEAYFTGISVSQGKQHQKAAMIN